MTSLFSSVELHTPNAEKAKGFYGELFGWTFAAVPMPPGLSYFGIEGRAKERAQRLGAKVLQPVTPVGQQGTMAVLSDPTGAVFALWQQVKA